MNDLIATTVPEDVGDFTTLVAGDPMKAAEAMREHVNRGMENTMKRLKPYFRIRKACGKTFFRSEKRQRQQIIDPSTLN